MLSVQFYANAESHRDFDFVAAAEPVVARVGMRTELLAFCLSSGPQQAGSPIGKR
jgi:hypothetical protein